MSCPEQKGRIRLSEEFIVQRLGGNAQRIRCDDEREPRIRTP
jgi:hypothetical protein